MKLKKGNGQFSIELEGQNYEINVSFASFKSTYTVSYCGKDTVLKGKFKAYYGIQEQVESLDFGLENHNVLFIITGSYRFDIIVDGVSIITEKVFEAKKPIAKGYLVPAVLSLSMGILASVGNIMAGSVSATPFFLWALIAIGCVKLGSSKLPTALKVILSVLISVVALLFIAVILIGIVALSQGY